MQLFYKDLYRLARDLDLLNSYFDTAFSEVYSACIEVGALEFNERDPTKTEEELIISKLPGWKELQEGGAVNYRLDLYKGAKEVLYGFDSSEKHFAVILYGQLTLLKKGKAIVQMRKRLQDTSSQEKMSGIEAFLPDWRSVCDRCCHDLNLEYVVEYLFSIISSLGVKDPFPVSIASERRVRVLSTASLTHSPFKDIRLEPEPFNNPFGGLKIKD